jgi:hypothetical protein
VKEPLQGHQFEPAGVNIKAVNSTVRITPECKILDQKIFFN